ncbi:unnamed protein product [Prunus armeniaca]
MAGCGQSCALFCMAWAELPPCVLPLLQNMDDSSRPSGRTGPSCSWMGRALPLCPAWISSRPSVSAIYAMRGFSWYDHASPGEGPYGRSSHSNLTIFPELPVDLPLHHPPIFGSAFWSHNWNVDSGYCHGLTAWHHSLLTPVLPGELLDLFPWRSVGSGLNFQHSYTLENFSRSMYTEKSHWACQIVHPSYVCSCDGGVKFPIALKTID